MKPLRILHAEAATRFGGQENRIFKEMCAMRDAGHHLELVCQPQAMLVEKLRAQGFTVHPVPMGGIGRFIRGVAAIRRILRAGHFDVLNTHSRKDTLIAGVAARLAGTPLIVRTRHLAIKPGSLLSYTIIPHCVTTVSEYVRGLLLARGVDPDRVATLYSPIPMPPLPEHSTLRDELRLPPDAIVVGCVAIMRERKGHHALIDAMADLLKRPEVFLVLVGDGSPLLLETLKASVQSRGLQNKVLFTGRRNDIPNVLAGFDLFALATEQEASGTVYAEAQAAGLPVIGTDVGGVSEMFEDGVSGILVPPRDPAALTAALQDLIDHPEKRRSMGRAGLRATRESGRFSLETLARDTERCYRHWLAQRERGPS